MRICVSQFINQRIFILLGPCLFFFAVVFLVTHSSTVSQIRSQVLYDHREKSFLDEVTNQTFGFEKIYALNLEERTDKSDALLDMSLETNVEIDLVPGVLRKDMPDRAIPAAMLKHGSGTIGAWRGHVNVLRNILEQKRETALIFEDDVDWDLRIHSQLQSYAKARRRLSGIADDEETFSPYGDDWDVLWLGHCRNTFNDEANATIGYLDHTLPDPRFLTSGLGSWTTFPEQTRFIQGTNDVCCTGGYAVTLSAARKLFHWMSSPNMEEPFDLALNRLCETQRSGLRCQTVMPPLFNAHYYAGPVSRSSDIHAMEDKDQDQENRAVGHTGATQYSTRMNLDRILLGLEPVDQFEGR